MNEISIQFATNDDCIPTSDNFIEWVEQVLKQEKAKGAVTIRIVDLAEITILNSTYRAQDKPTNVLSFPFVMPEGVDMEPILGDIAICAEVVKNEAEQQNKPILEQFAHMTIHGMLHLLGYDHGDDGEAKMMEQKETEFMKELGFANPY